MLAMKGRNGEQQAWTKGAINDLKHMARCCPHIVKRLGEPDSDEGARKWRAFMLEDKNAWGSD